MGRIKLISETFNSVNKNLSSWKSIKPVLVGEGEIKKGDGFFCRGIIYKCKHISSTKEYGDSIVSTEGFGERRSACQKVITQETESLYEQITKGQLVEGVEYEFESVTKNWSSPPMGKIITETKLVRPLKVVNEVKEMLEQGIKTLQDSIDFNQKVYDNKLYLLEDVDTIEEAFKEGINACRQFLNHSLQPIKVDSSQLPIKGEEIINLMWEIKEGKKHPTKGYKELCALFNTNEEPTCKKCGNMGRCNPTLQDPDGQVCDCSGYEITSEEINQVAIDESQQDWDDLTYKTVYQNGFEDGAKWAIEKIKSSK